MSYELGVSFLTSSNNNNNNNKMMNNNKMDDKLISEFEHKITLIKRTQTKATRSELIDTLKMNDKRKGVKNLYIQQLNEGKEVIVCELFTYFNFLFIVKVLKIELLLQRMILMLKK